MSGTLRHRPATNGPRRDQLGTGFSVHGYLMQLRLRTGLDRIQGRHGGIGEVGLMLGFSSHSHFTTSFRRAFGLTPTAVLASTPALAAS